MLPVLCWYVVVQTVGILSWPLAWRLFDRLPDRGYSFTKHLGVLFTGITLWLGNAYGLLPNEPGGAWLALVIAGAAGLSLGKGGLRKDAQGVRPLIQWLKADLAHVVWVEALFLAAFAFWVWVRACDPAIAHTEQPMDLMFLSSVQASGAFPPQDAWLAGFPISYYYLGYWLLSLLAFLAGQRPEVAYNLGQASWFALLFVGCYGVGSNLARLGWQQQTPGDGRVALRAPAAGLLASVSVACAGNFASCLEWLNQKGTAIGLAAWCGGVSAPAGGAQDGWWWWRSSRVLKDQDLLGRPIEIIDEFPFFSYLLGDNHPHLLSMPFLLPLIALALNHLAAGPQDLAGAEAPCRLRSLKRLQLQPLTFLALAATVGSIALINVWDLLPAAALAALAFLGREWAGARGGRSAASATLVFGVLLFLSILALFWPFLLSAEGQVDGIRPNLFHPTRLAQFVLMFGTLVPGLLGLYIIAWKQTPPPIRACLRSLAWVWGGTGAAFAAGVYWAFGSSSGRSWLDATALPPPSAGHAQEILGRWARDPATLLFLSLGLAAGACLLLRQARSSGEPATMLALVMAVLGLFLLLLPELFYLQDSFATRMNTIFKLYYQAWLLLALAAAYGTVRAPAAGRCGRSLSAMGFVAMLAGLAYATAALPDKIGGFRAHSLTLDGIAHWSPDEGAAVRWIRAYVPQTAVVAEGAGDSYSSEASRMSAATGRPTLLGWMGHESQWRGGASLNAAGDRRQALELIYTSATGRGLLELLRAWGIDYVYLGPAERSRYGITPDRKRQLQEALEAVFERGEITVYRSRSPHVRARASSR